MGLNKKFRLFKKGYLPGWTEEVFVIRHSIPGPVATYKLEEWDGSPLQGTFYKQDNKKFVSVTTISFVLKKNCQTERK